MLSENNRKILRIEIGKLLPRRINYLVGLQKNPIIKTMHTLCELENKSTLVEAQLANTKYYMVTKIYANICLITGYLRSFSQRRCMLQVRFVITS